MEWDELPEPDSHSTFVTSIHLNDLDPTEPIWQLPRKPGLLRHAVRSVAACSIRAWLRAYHRYEIVGRHNLPTNGSFVMVANHTSHLDALCLLSALPLRRLPQAYPAAAADYFFKTLPRLALSVFIINAIRFDRSAHARQSLDLCRALLAEPGNILILFPEGTRATDDRIARFRPGIGMLLAGTNVPVVPCHLSGTRQALPKGAWVPLPRTVRLTIGMPQTFAGWSQKRTSIRRLCDHLRRSVLQLGELDRVPHQPQLAMASNWGDS